MKRLTLLLAGFCNSASAQDITYFPPGDIEPAGISGIADRTVHFPDWVFPLKVGTETGEHAFLGTQLPQYHGLNDNNDRRLYTYPHRDNQCEPRRHRVNPCPSAKGHQGNDIRPHSPRNNYWDVVAVEAGRVVSVNDDTWVSIRNGGRTVTYMHMHPGSIDAAGIEPGVDVAQGQVIGRVSNYMGGRPNTSIHLHIHAYSGTFAAANFLPVYPSLIAAYRRAWGLDDLVRDGRLGVDPDRELRGGVAPKIRPDGVGAVANAQACDGIALAPPLQTVDVSRFSSFWIHNCSVMGLVANIQSGERAFYYYRAKTSLADAVSPDPSLFSGRVEGSAYAGRAKLYNSRCGDILYNVAGLADTVADVPVVTLRGSRPRRDRDCQEIGIVTDELIFTYLGNAASAEPPATHQPAPPQDDRITLSEQTRNFLAITFYPQEPGGEIIILPYFARFPGTSPEPGLTDSSGGLIPRLKSDEAGVAISWVWLRKRARHIEGQTSTPRGIAYSMAGVDPTTCSDDVRPNSAAIRNLGRDKAVRYCDQVSAYLAGYIGLGGGRDFASDYFGRSVGIDEVLNFAQPTIAFNWLRTMYSHESGRPALIDADTFARGVRYGEDWIAEFYLDEPGHVRPDAWYGNPCNFGQEGCGQTAPDAPPADSTPAPITLDSLAEAIQRLERRVNDLEGGQ
ncbi:M23 family metallopeptidase [Paracoccus sp. 22332]|uniref:M23 family metallopeptidase n=1 Tax=Paracoccus sp. 22332 TaxID=3453913 RepID=UPI003F862ECE